MATLVALSVRASDNKLLEKSTGQPLQNRLITSARRRLPQAQPRGGNRKSPKGHARAINRQLMRDFSRWQNETYPGPIYERYGMTKQQWSTGFWAGFSHQFLRKKNSVDLLMWNEFKAKNIS